MEQAEVQFTMGDRADVARRAVRRSDRADLSEAAPPPRGPRVRGGPPSTAVASTAVFAGLHGRDAADIDDATDGDGRTSPVREGRRRRPRDPDAQDRRESGAREDLDKPDGRHRARRRAGGGTEAAVVCVEGQVRGTRGGQALPPLRAHLLDLDFRKLAADLRQEHSSPGIATVRVPTPFVL